MKYAFINLIESVLEWEDPFDLPNFEAPLKLPIPPCTDADSLPPSVQREIERFMQVITGVVTLSEAAGKVEEDEADTIDIFCTEVSKFMPTLPVFENTEFSRDAKSNLVIYYIDIEEKLLATLDKLKADVQQIEDAHFFGNGALENACRMLVDSLFTKSSLSLMREFQASTERAGKRLLLRYPDMVQGGYGFTEETAWVMQQDDNETVGQEYFILRQLGFPEPKMQSLSCKDKVYDIHTIEIVIDDQKITVRQFFDITKYWEKKQRILSNGKKKKGARPVAAKDDSTTGSRRAY